MVRDSARKKRGDRAARRRLRPPSRAAASGGRLYLYALAAAGQEGVERAIEILKEEIERGMRLMGVTSIDQLTADRLRWR